MGQKIKDGVNAITIPVVHSRARREKDLTNHGPVLFLSFHGRLAGTDEAEATAVAVTAPCHFTKSEHREAVSTTPACLRVKPRARSPTFEYWVVFPLDLCESGGW